MTSLKVPVTSSDHIQGNIHAPITLLEYGDFECSYCGMAHPIVKRVQKHFGDQLRFVFHHFPLAEIHPHAETAAETAEFAGTHQRFWEMYDLLFENQTRLNMTLLSELIKILGLPVAELEDALENKKFQLRVRKDLLSGVWSGVNGTPTFFINGNRHNGSFEFEELVNAINQLSTLNSI